VPAGDVLGRRKIVPAVSPLPFKVLSEPYSSFAIDVGQPVPKPNEPVLAVPLGESPTVFVPRGLRFWIALHGTCPAGSIDVVDPAGNPQPYRGGFYAAPGSYRYRAHCEGISRDEHTIVVVRSDAAGTSASDQSAMVIDANGQPWSLTFGGSRSGVTLRWKGQPPRGPYLLYLQAPGPGRPRQIATGVAEFRLVPDLVLPEELYRFWFTNTKTGARSAVTQLRINSDPRDPAVTLDDLKAEKAPEGGWNVSYKASLLPSWSVTMPGPAISAPDDDRGHWDATVHLADAEPLVIRAEGMGAVQYHVRGPFGPTADLKNPFE